MKSTDLNLCRRRAAFGASAGFLFALIAAVAIAAAGCSDSGANASSTPSGESKDGGKNETAKKDDTKEARTAQQILNDLQATYRKADRYADEAKLHRHFTRNGENFEQMFRHEVAFERPNKLRLECYDAKFICDGENCFATVPHVPNTVMKVPAPKALAPIDVLRDSQLRQALQETPVGSPITLLLLMQDGALDEMIRGAMAPPKLLPTEAHDGRRCERVELDTNYGKLVFWIDPTTNVLVRLDMPPLLSKQWDQPGDKTNSLTIVFSKAQFDAKLPPETFKLDIPTDAKITDTLVPVLQSTPAAARSEPTNLKLTKLWSAADVKNPGNVLKVDQANGLPRLYVIDGARAVAEIDAEGKVVARHELDLPESSIIFYLRSAVNKQGKRYFLGSAVGQSQLHVFDENWKRVLSYPKPEVVADAMLTNVLITDLAADGKLELCVGYFGEAGLQGISLDGHRLWPELKHQYVFPATVTEPDAQGKRKLLGTDNKGHVLVFSDQGEALQDLSIPGRSIGFIQGADLDGTGKNQYCALGYSYDQTEAAGKSPEQNNVAMGIALEGREQWIYDLPDGAPGRPVEILSSADVAGDGKLEWLIAAPDSSIHILNADGTPLDKFNNGAALCGLAGVKLGDKQVLLISSALEKPNGDSHSVLEAWQVEPIQ